MLSGLFCIFLYEIEPNPTAHDRACRQPYYLPFCLHFNK